ncbi:MAG: site-2 protease family protein [Patescibacteria group bacterium]
MFLNLIFASPAIGLAWALAILASLTLHEFAHAFVAMLLGDRTAEREGRLTLNPLAHLDLMGLIPLLLFGFGWAKPVPFNPYNLKNPKWDSVAIAIAGPAANLVLALLSGVLFRFSLVSFGPSNLLTAFLFLMIILNLFMLLFNIIPIHPLDGSKLFFALFDDPKYESLRTFVAVRGPQILLLAVFISILTNIDVFFFIAKPAYAICNGFIGHSCLGYFGGLFP